MSTTPSALQIGVVIPTYNRAALCLEALESVWAQTLPPREIVVVDDGSTDDTSARLAPLADAGRITYHRQANAHLSAARNAGFACLSPGVNSVLFLDDDDRLHSDALERLARALDAHPDAPLAYGRPRLVAPDGTPTGEWGIEDFDGSDVWNSLIRRNFICTAGGVLLRRSALGDVPPWDAALRGAEDWDLWLRLAESGAAFARVDTPHRPVIDYRTLPDSLSRNYENTLPQEENVLRKAIQRAEAAGRTDRVRLIEAQIAERQVHIAQARAEGVPLSDALLSPRHRALRKMIERTGIAGLWRRVPLRARLRLREIMGVSRSA